MKNYILIALIIIPIICYSQKDSVKSHIDLFKSEYGLHYINKHRASSYIVDFKGDSVSSLLKSAFYKIDDKVIAITNYPISFEEFPVINNLEKIDLLLTHFYNFEMNYLEKYVYFNELEIKKEFFFNKENKRFLLWNFDIPDKYRKNMVKTKSLDKTTVPLSNSNLFFVSNKVVVGINIATINEDNIISDIDYLKEVANNIDVYGGPINLAAWYYKLQQKEKNEPFIYNDTINNYRVEIPSWMNITKSSSNRIWLGSMPDINNVINIISVSSFYKTEYRSFEEFNNHFITGNDFGKPAKFNTNVNWIKAEELINPKSCNGLTYKVTYTVGLDEYNCQFITYETKTAFILISYTATEKTFDIHKNKLDKFLQKFQIF